MNPFHGNFNPGTTNAQKMFIKRSKGHVERKWFDLSKEFSAKIHQFVSKAREIGNCCNIPVAFNGHNQPMEFANRISQNSEVSLKLVQRKAHKCFATTIGCTANKPALPITSCDLDPSNNNDNKTTIDDQVNASVLVKAIKNLLTLIGYEDLLLHKEKFSFKDSTTGEIHIDDPTMVNLILLQIKPDIIMGMDSLKAQFETMKMHEFGNDVSKMLTKMQSICNTLKQNGHTPDFYCHYLYTTLKTGPNVKFNGFMDCIIDDIQSGKDISCNQLIIAAQTKYNNMVEDKSWGKVDPHDAKIMALTTKFEQIEKTQGASVNSNTAAHETNLNG